MGRDVASAPGELAIEPRDERVLHYFAKLCRARYALTARQSEILYTIALGHTYRPYLARALGISLGGLRWHMGNLYRQLGIDIQMGTSSPLLVMRVWPLLARAREKVEWERTGGEDAMMGGRPAGGATGAGAAHLGDVGADGALWTASVPTVGGGVGAGGEGA